MSYICILGCLGLSPNVTSQSMLGWLHCGVVVDVAAIDLVTDVVTVVAVIFIVYFADIIIDVVFGVIVAVF